MGIAERKEREKLQRRNDIMDAKYYVDGVIAKKRAVIAKSITLIESALPAHQEIAQSIIDSLLPHSGNAMRIGITGVPGVGKSTFIESFGMMLVEQGHHQMDGFDELVIAPDGQALGIRQGHLEFTGQTIHSHGITLKILVLC